ncbi:MAG: hypothetical protein KF764_00435 [Labilithrix sp.]|nr:hypothetical protein [Labilithrix sp.]
MLARTVCGLSAALVLACGCRAVNADARDVEDAGVTPADDGGPLPDAGATEADASEDAPSRLEPPIVRPVPGTAVETVAGSSTKGSLDGAGAAAQFDNPVGVLVDPSGALLVTEYDGGRLRKIALDGQTSTLTTGLFEPFALVATDDAIYVQTDRDRNGGKGTDTGTIWKIALTGGAPELVIESLGRPRGLARLADGRVVVSDRTRHTISILNPADRTLTPLAGSGAPGFVDGKGAAARFNEPYGTTVLPDGSILVADSRNHVIRRVTLDGDVTTFAGDGKPGMKDDADKRLARFDKPIDVAVDVAGNAFVSDRGNFRIRRIATSGSVETAAGDGTQGFADGVGTATRFYGQEQLDVTPDGKVIYVSDGNDGDGQPFHRIRRVAVP